MMSNRRKFLAGGAGLLAAAGSALGQRGYSDSSFAGGAIAGPFRPHWESLNAYRYPDWFRDAKFGMWAHWSPQCVPEQGDWYAQGCKYKAIPSTTITSRHMAIRPSSGTRIFAIFGALKTGISRN